MWNLSDLLYTLMILASLGFAVVVALVGAQIWTMAKEEFREMSKVRRDELKKILEEDDRFFSELVAKYRADAKVGTFNW
jgi:hypothetical protein